MANLEFLIKNGRMPNKGSNLAAGYDIHTNETVIINPGQKIILSTGVFLANCPENIYLRVAPRSKLANRYAIDVLAGVVDSDYRGEIKVLLINHGKNPAKFNLGDAIAQLIPTMLYQIEPVQVTKLQNTERGSEGIDSTDERRKGNIQDVLETKETLTLVFASKIGATHMIGETFYRKHPDHKFWSVWVDNTWKIMSGEPIGELNEL
jgi:dUTP pyrophosphatase